MHIHTRISIRCFIDWYYVHTDKLFVTVTDTLTSLYIDTMDRVQNLRLKHR